MKKTVLSLFLILLLTGCAPIGLITGLIGAGVNFGKNGSGNGGSGGIGNATGLPVVTEMASTGSANNSPVVVDYKIIDETSSSVSLVVEYSSDDGTTWSTATPGAGGDGLTGLTSSPSGTAHTFEWNYKADLPTQTQTNIKIRITPSDETGTGVVAILANVRIGNTAPSVQVFMSGVHSGNVTIQYLLTDGESDNCSVTVEYSTDGGTNWNNGTTAGGDGSPGTPSNERTGLISSATGTLHIYLWDSITDGVAISAPTNVMVRLTPNDGVAGGNSAISASFTVNQSSGGTGGTRPTIQIVSIGEASKSGKCKIVYTLSDAESNICTLQIQWTNNGGATYQDCTSATSTGNPFVDGDGNSGLTSSPTGISHSFVWDISKAILLKGREWVKLRLIPSDSAPGSTVNSHDFPVKGGWSPQQIMGNTSASSFYVQVAVDPNDNVHAIWRDRTSGGRYTLYHRKFDGYKWSPSVTIYSASHFVDHPSMAIDSQGTIHVTWQEYITKSNDEIFYHQSSDEGITWDSDPGQGGIQGPVNISNSTSYSQHPQIAVDKTGKIHLVWEEAIPSGWREDTVYSNSATGTAGSWLSPVKITNDPTTDVDYPVLAVDSSNRIHVVWADDRNGNNDVFYSSSSTGGAGTWSTSVNISNNSGNGGYPQIAIDSTSNLCVVWEDDTLGNYDILYSSSSGGTTWTAPLNLSGSPFNNSVDAHLAIGFNNEVYVVWQEDILGQGEVFFRLKNGSGWASVAQITNESGDSANPKMAISQNGNATLVWNEWFSGQWNVQYSFYEQILSSPKNIAAKSMDLEDSEICIEPNGKLHAVWEDNTLGTGKQEIYYSQNSGTGWSTPINISNTASTDSYNPKIVASAGRIHVIWIEALSGEEGITGNKEVYYTTSTDGVNFTAFPNISNNPYVTWYRGASLAMDKNTGKVHFVWEGNDLSGNIQIFYTATTDGQNFVPTPYAITTTTANSDTPDIAVDSTGKIHVVWEEGSSPEDIYYSSSTTGLTGSWSTPVNVSNTVADSDSPQVITDSKNWIHISWEEGSPDDEVYYVFSTTGAVGTWDGEPSFPGVQPASNISNNSGDSDGVAMAVDSEDNLYICWRDNTPGNHEILLRKLVNTQWTRPQNVSNTSAHSDGATMVVDRQNRLHILWDDASPSFIAYVIGTPSTNSVFAENFDSATPPSPSAGWTATGGFVSSNTFPPVGMENNFMIADSQSTAIADAQLISPVMDFSTSTIVVLTFDSALSLKANVNVEKAEIDASTDGGANWTNVLTLTDSNFSHFTTQQLDISSVAGGKSNVVVRFRYSNANLDGYWAIDHIDVRGRAGSMIYHR